MRIDVELIGGWSVRSPVRHQTWRCTRLHRGPRVARVACAAGASPAVQALISYAEAEADALLRQNLDILRVMTEVLIVYGTLTGEQVDEIISAGVVAGSLKKERLRRIEWKAREASAAEFTKRLET